MNIVKEIIDKNTVTLRLITGETDEAKSFYAYVLFPADVHSKIELNNESGVNDISKYGIIIHSDYGGTPSKTVEAKILSLFREKHLKT